jgi:hypothetical protein
LCIGASLATTWHIVVGQNISQSAKNIGADSNTFI